MALIHLKSQKWSNGRAMCLRQSRNAFDEKYFIESYQKHNGSNFCSKCANFLIKKGVLVAADSTIPENHQIVIDKVTAGTQVLKEKYIIATKEWATKKFKQMQDLEGWTFKQWCEDYNIKLETVYYRFGSRVRAGESIEGAELREEIDRKEYNGKKYYRMQDAIRENKRTVAAGYKAYEDGKVNEAKRHYADSVMKLSYRIMEKSMDINKMKVVTASIDRNIDTTISDGVNTVKAFTIIAALDSTLVRPHYRYLVH
jgi:hypothetical protein